MAESEAELKSLFMEMGEENEKADLKLSIQKTETMASGSITTRQMDGETMETETLFSWAPNSMQTVTATAAMKLKDACSLEENL